MKNVPCLIIDIPANVEDIVAELLKDEDAQLPEMANEFYEKTLSASMLKKRNKIFKDELMCITLESFYEQAEKIKSENIEVYLALGGADYEENEANVQKMKVWPMFFD